MNDANNAGAREPTTEMIDRGVAFALSVSLSGEYNWSQYIRDLYCHMAAAAVRLDEAAIRKDEREKCAAIAEQPQFANITRVEVFKGPEWTEETGSAALVCAHARIIAQAIRNGGKQP